MRLISLNACISLNCWILFFVILNLWKVVNKGEELEDEAWSKNIKIRQTLDILTSYPNEY